MSKLAWYAVIMVAIDVLLYIARFCVKAAKNARTPDVASAECAPTGTENTSASAGNSANTPSA